MATFRDLLNKLQSLTEEQLDTQIKIIPTGYCDLAPVLIDGYSPFDGGISLEFSKGDIISTSDDIGAGCSDVEEWDTPASELSKELEAGEQMYSPEEVVLSPGLPYLRIFNVEK